MQTVDKAMKLLGFFTPAEPEIGLSDLARLAEFDKAATRRFLVALQKHAFIEQNPANKKYRLGSAFLHFAQVREATSPLASVVAPILEALAEATGETAHASHFSGGALVTIGIKESSKVTRVHLDPSEVLPLHATASGLAYLAFGPKGTLEEAVAAGLTAHTPHTITSAVTLRKVTAETRRRGYAISGRSYEDEVTGIAMPFFDGAAEAVGALAVATPSSRMTDDLRRLIANELRGAVLAVTRGIGGVPVEGLLAAVSGKRTV